MKRRAPEPLKSARRGAFLFRTALALLALTAMPGAGRRLTGGWGALAAQALPPTAEPASDSVLPEAREDTLPGLLLAHNLTGGGRLLVYRQPESALVAIRFSFPLLPEFGAVRAFARMAQRLARPDLDRQAGAYGARVELQCSYDRASFAITGAARDAPELARLLRQALTWGGWGERDIRAARFAEGSREQQRRETPEPLLEDRLAARLFPSLPAADSAPRRTTAAMLRAFWDATFRPDRMQAVVVGRITDADAQALMSGWPPAPAAGPEPPADDSPDDVTVTEPPASAARARTAAPPAGRGAQRPRSRAAADSARAAAAAPAAAQEPPSSVGQPQVLYSWAAIGWPTRTDAAAAAVAARLVSARLSPAQLRRARAELWWSGRGRALVAIGSATTPDSSGAATRGAATGPGGLSAGAGGRAAATSPAEPGRWLAAAVAATKADLTREQVQAAGQAISRELLLSTRTPEGLARFLGEMFERTDRPTGAQLFLRQLGRVDVRAVERSLEPEDEPEKVEVNK